MYQRYPVMRVAGGGVSFITPAQVSMHLPTDRVKTVIHTELNQTIRDTVCVVFVYMHVSVIRVCIDVNLNFGPGVTCCKLILSNLISHLILISKCVTNLPRTFYGNGTSRNEVL